MQSHLISRRSLIKSSLFGLACSAAPAIRAKDEWSGTYDVVIIGSGFAGLAAAYSALENGVKSVLVLEKMNVFGGNSCINGGQISLAGSGLQKSKGIKDSPKLMEEDMLRVG
uniref:FAD-dependent oxidoreductase n=1 Tax=Parasutterella excrementihominis TaxID=487175 RepID=UPI003FEE7AFD